MSFVLTVKAKSDVLAIARYIADANPQAARKWYAQTFELFRMLGDMPSMGQARDDVLPGVRVFPKGNYLILFRKNEEQAVILRVVHAARNWPKLMR
jgi:toxin ParE1/3/4